MPAVVRPAPEAIGRGGPSSHFCHTCVSVAGIHPSLRSYPQFVAGIHPKGNQDRFPITDVGNDLSGWIPVPACVLARRSAAARKREDKLHRNDQASLYWSARGAATTGSVPSLPLVPVITMTDAVVPTRSFIVSGTVRRRTRTGTR